MLTAAVAVYCVVALVGLWVVGVPRQPSPERRLARPPEGASAGSAGEPAGAAGGGSRTDAPSRMDAPGPAPVDGPPAPGSPRGLALAYRYRELPPGGESRYEWMVQVAGARALLDGVDTVTYQMEPPAKNGGEFVSRDRAGDGFPLFGHGPGGWFGVTAVVQFRDGTTETLTRRVELPEPE